MPPEIRPSVAYIPALDGLRAISIGLVLAGHEVLHHSTSNYYQDVGIQMGSYGVSVFFVISGYLITMLLLREEAKRGEISLRNFYVRRILRIFPAFYTYLVCIGVLAAIGIIPNRPWRDLIACALYVRNIYVRLPETHHLWSLSLEEQFYLAWPSVVIVVAARRRLAVLGLAVAAFTAWRAYLVSVGRTNEFLAYMRPDQRMDTILVGCALALMEGGPRFERLSRAVLERWWAGAAIFAAMGVWLAYARTMQRATPYSIVVYHTGTGILTVALVYWLMRNARGFPWLAAPPMLFVGRLSYSLYLWQQLFLITSPSRMGGVRWFPLDMALTFACALGSYYLVETPFLRLKGRFER